MTNHKTAYQHAMKIADHIDEVGESPYELVKQLHTAGLITPDPRKTYDLPAPTNTREENHIWFTGHLIATDGDLAHDGTVTHYPRRLAITVDTHEGEVLVLDYADARRVALALLAAIEEVEATATTAGTATTKQNYSALPEGTIVAADNGAPWQKRKNGEWISHIFPENRPDDLMDGLACRILRRGWSE